MYKRTLLREIQMTSWSCAMCDVMSGFFQIYKVKNKSADHAILKVREWSAFWGKPFEILADSGPGFWDTFEEEASRLVIQSDTAVVITALVRPM